MAALLRIDLDDMWGFFDLDAPSSRRSMDPTDPLLQKLKGKLNRQRLLFHPDKNGHPEARGDFVGLSKKKRARFVLFLWVTLARYMYVTCASNGLFDQNTLKVDSFSTVGGGFKYFSFSSLFGEMIQFD